MATWKNLDTLASYSKLAELKGHVNIADAMAGEKGAERVKKYSTPMAAGLTYNYAAKQVDETVLDALAKLAASLAHIDSKKKGRALCEVFGAYGWAEGLKLMKWLLTLLVLRLQAVKRRNKRFPLLLI